MRQLDLFGGDITMKTLTLLFLTHFLLAPLAYAQSLATLGLYKAEDGSRLETYVMDFSRGDISLDVGFADEGGGYGFITTFLSLDHYQLLFEGDEEVRAIEITGFIGKSLASAGNNDDQSRWVKIKQTYNDDHGRLVHEKELSFTITHKQIDTVHLTVYKRRQILGIPLDMKRVFDRQQTLALQTPGLGLYLDNRGWLVGRTSSYEAVKEALQKPMKDVFQRVCEIECQAH